MVGEDKLNKLMAEVAQEAKSMKGFSNETGNTYDEVYRKANAEKKPGGDNLIGNISRIIGFAIMLFSLFTGYGLYMRAITDIEKTYYILIIFSGIISGFLFIAIGEIIKLLGRLANK